MPAIALLKFVQGSRQPPAGQALIVLPSVQVDITNGGDNTDVKSWRLELLDHPWSAGTATPGSPVILGQNGNDSTPTANRTPAPATLPGSYRIRLTVWTGTGYTGAQDVDIRNFTVRAPNQSVILPPYQKLPDPLPLPGEGKPGEKPDELNFEGQPWGWSGPTKYGYYGSTYDNFRLLNATLYLIDTHLAGGGPLPIGTAFGQFLFWNGAAWDFTPEVLAGPTGSLATHTASPIFDRYNNVTKLVDTGYQSVQGYSSLCSRTQWDGSKYIPKVEWQSIPLMALDAPNYYGQVISYQYVAADAAWRVRWSKDSPVPSLPPRIPILTWDPTANEAYWYAAYMVPGGSSGAVLFWNSDASEWQASASPTVGQHLVAGWNPVSSYYYTYWETTSGTVPDGTNATYGQLLVWRNDQWVASSVPGTSGGYIPYVWAGDHIEWLPLTAGTTDELVKTSATDSTAQFLNDKVQTPSTGGLTKTVIVPGGGDYINLKLRDGTSPNNVLYWTGAVWDVGNPPGTAAVTAGIDGYVNQFPASVGRFFTSDGSTAGGVWSNDVNSIIPSDNLNVDKLVAGAAHTVLISDIGPDTTWLGGSNGEFLGVSGGVLGFFTPPDIGEVNTGSNQGTDGIGVYDTKVGVDLQFRNVAPASTKVTVVLNGKDVDIDVAEGNIVHQNLSGAGSNDHTAIDSHIADVTGNPHAVTAAQASAAPSSHVGSRGSAQHGVVGIGAGLEGFAPIIPDASDWALITLAGVPSFGRIANGHIDAAANIAVSKFAVGANNTALITNISGNVVWQAGSPNRFLGLDPGGALGFLQVNHNSLSNIGTNSHSVIDAHIANVTTNPHVVDLQNLGGGSLSDLNSLVSGADLDTVNDPRTDDNAVHSGDTAGGDLNGTFPNPNVDDGADGTAVHVNVSDEFDSASGGQDTSPDATDRFLLENSSTSWSKRWAVFGDISHTILSNIGSNSHSAIDSHIGSSSNPHSVTAAQASALSTSWPATRDINAGTNLNGGGDLSNDRTLNLDQDLLGIRKITFASLYNAGTMNNNTVNVDPDNGLKQYVTITNGGGSAVLNFKLPASAQPCNFMVKLIKNGTGTFTLDSDSGSVVAAGGGIDVKEYVSSSIVTTLGVFFDGTDFHVTSSPGETTASVNLT